jgi:hypothetical protein
MRAALIVLLALVLAGPARAQVPEARRLGMGGVLLSEVTQSSTQNVAYRAVPTAGKGLAGYTSIPLPLGIVQVLADPPELDSSNPNFNVFQIARLISVTPYTLQLVEPEELASDIVVNVGLNNLTVDLGALQDLFPDRDLRFGTTFATPNLEFGTRNVFVGIRPQGEARNTARLDPTLQAALGEGAPFAPNTAYGFGDEARAQAAISVSIGGALPLLSPKDAPEGDPRKGGVALYAGARAKYLRGIALWQARARAAFATGDTIFGASTPMTVDYAADVRQTPDPGFDAGQGVAADAGVVVFVDKFEIGLGVNDIGATITWDRTNLDHYDYDEATNSNVRTPVERNATFRSQFPVTGSLSVAYRTNGMIFAGTLDRTANELWLPRAGAEVWLGPVPLRGGLYLDSYQLLQFTTGSGFRLGKYGLDLALATHSRGLTTTRGLELAASLGIY